MEEEERIRMGMDVLTAEAAAVPGSPVIVLPVPTSSRAAERLALVRDELIAWFKTLASAAVYATLIVTFGFQVARVEGMSMAPTLEDQDRLTGISVAFGSFIFRM